MKDFNEINEDVEKNIKISSMEFKGHLNYYVDELNEIINKMDGPEVR